VGYGSPPRATHAFAKAIVLTALARLGDAEQHESPSLTADDLDAGELKRSRRRDRRYEPATERYDDRRRHPEATPQLIGDKQ
jgi:hypothetical protein